MTKLKSPLRYPGGKSRAIKIINEFIPQSVKQLCSPFFGGGSVEIYCASERGIKVYGYDIFQPLVDFWQCLLSDKDKLASLVEAYYPLNRADFYKLQREQCNYPNKFDRAASFFVLNRSSFSGSTLSGGMSPGHDRFTPSCIDRLRNFTINNLTVTAEDFKQSIVNHSDSFLYLDPPYLIKGALYGEKGSVHKGFDHEGLKGILTSRTNWVLSYNNCPEILDMYKDYQIYYPDWKYGMSRDKNSKELLIVNYE